MLPQLRQEVHLDAGDQGAGRIQGVAPEDRGKPPHRNVTDHATTDRRHNAQHDGRHPIESGRQPLGGSGGGPTTDREGVHEEEPALCPPLLEWEKVGNQGAGESGCQVGGIAQGYGETLLQQGVTQHAAAQSGNDGQDREPHQVHLEVASHHATQNAVGDHAQ